MTTPVLSFKYNRQINNNEIEDLPLEDDTLENSEDETDLFIFLLAKLRHKDHNMSFLPYIICTNIKTNEQLNLLLDTEANTNVLRPGIL